MRQTIKLLLLILITSCTSMKDTSIQKDTPSKSYVQDIKKIKYAKDSIVLLVPMSGTHESIGKNILNACILGNQNSNMDIYVVDTNDYPDDLRSSLFKNLRAAIGPVFFKETHKFASMFQEVPIFSLSNNINANNNHIYACGLSPQEEITAILKYIQRMRVLSLTVFVPKGAFFNNIEKIVQKESVKYNITEDNLSIVHYDSSVNLSKLVQIANSKAILVFEPVQLHDKSTIVFTLSSLALSNPFKWEGTLFAYADNVDQKSFIESYQKTFHSSPTVISLAAYDLVKMMNESFIMKKDMFDEKYQGTLGSFQVKKGKGIVRNLEIFRLENGKKIHADYVSTLKTEGERDNQ